MVKWLLGFSPLLTIPFLLFLHWLSGRATKYTSKSTLSQRYYAAQSSSHKLDRFDYVVTTILRIIFVAVLFTIVAAVIIIALISFYDIPDKTITGCIESVLDFSFNYTGPLVLTVVALIAFWGTFNKKDCLFYRIEDIYKEKRLKERLIDALLCYFATFLTKLYTIIMPISELTMATCLFALCGIGLCLWSSFCSLRAITETITMIFEPNDSLKLLKYLYFKIRQKRTRTTLPKDTQIPFEDSLDYLFDEISKSSLNFANEKIFFRDFGQEFSTFKQLPGKVTTFSLIFVISLQMSLQISGALNLINSLYDPIIILLMLILTTFLTILIIAHITKLRHTIVHLHIGSWGFVSKEAKKPFSTLSSHTMDKERCTYLKAVYNIISLFRDMLTTSDNDILRCLKNIYDFVRKNQDHYIVYTSCRYLLHIEKPDLIVEFDHEMPLDDVARRITIPNTAEIMVDILRPGSQDQLHRSVKKYFSKKPLKSKK